MVLKYRGAPPFKVPVQSSVTWLGREYNKAVASEEMIRNIAQDYRIIEIGNYDTVKEIMDTTGLVEGTDWWLVRWSDEGLPNPNTGSDYVVKIRVPPSSSVTIAYLLPLGEYAYVVSWLWYASGNVTLRVSRQDTPNISISNAEFPVFEYYGTGLWVPDAALLWFVEHRRQYIVWEFTNNGSSDEYVYIAIIIIRKVTVSSERVAVAGYRKKINNETITFTTYLPFRTPIAVKISIGIAGDGTNAVTGNIYVYDFGSDTYVQIATFSNSSTTLTWYPTYVVIRSRIGSGIYCPLIKIEFSTVGSGDCGFAIQLLYNLTRNVKSEYKRLGGSYTSDGNGQTDTVTLLDYTSSKNHIGRLMRVKATGDANTTQLQLQVDGEVVWDFLNDGDTCELDIEHVKKVELLVNDNGSATTTSTTTVNYVVQYEEEASFLTY